MKRLRGSIIDGLTYAGPAGEPLTIAALGLVDKLPPEILADLEAAGLVADYSPEEEAEHAAAKSFPLETAVELKAKRARQIEHKLGLLDEVFRTRLKRAIGARSEEGDAEELALILAEVEPLHAELAGLVSPKELAAITRRRRDALLSVSDYWMVSDQPTEALPTGTTRAAWLSQGKVYRQALRDIPEQAGFPASITWPVPQTFGAVVAEGV